VLLQGKVKWVVPLITDLCLYLHATPINKERQKEKRKEERKKLEKE